MNKETATFVFRIMCVIMCLFIYKGTKQYDFKN